MFVTKLEQLRQRRDALREMVRGMSSELFTEEERGVVTSQLRACEEAYAALAEALSAKRALYTQHVRRLEEHLAARRDYLSRFDSVLECESAVACAVTEEQRRLQAQLSSLYEAVDRDPCPATEHENYR